MFEVLLWKYFFREYNQIIQNNYSYYSIATSTITILTITASNEYSEQRIFVMNLNSCLLRTLISKMQFQKRNKKWMNDSKNAFVLINLCPTRSVESVCMHLGNFSGSFHNRWTCGFIIIKLCSPRMSMC